MEQQKEVEDAMFWLPPEFLNDDVFISQSHRNKSMSNLEGSTSTTETESDEEDYLYDLSRKLAYSTLEDTNKSTEIMAGSPQSTLYGCKSVPEVNYNDFPVDYFYAAVGEQLAIMKMSKRNGFVNPNSQFQTAQQQQQQMYQQQQMMKQLQLQQQQQQMYQRQFVHENRGRNGGGGNMKAGAAAAPLSAWPTLQQSKQHQPPRGSGMRAVFLGNPNNPKRESVGTGVFLPRQIGAPIETRKKRGCSTVLLPDKVVHALNLNLEAQNHRNGGQFPSNKDVEMRYRNNVLMAEQRRQQLEKDLRLPQEWTY
ncbi:uncharacterized protein [Rutidosis leptorrhynchoides]|uniref:uncharacterized protein isoform X2 n=1 Tax=Rutidosis leptorrhynchoides TaxID=125765 RepID=UPI003A990CD5